jgi:3-methyladenine DNA glycosylase AlkD
MPATAQSAEFVAQLESFQSDAELAKYQRYFKTGGEEFIGVRMGDVFALAKEFVAMEPAAIEELLESDVHEVRAGAMSIMDKSARANKTPDERRVALHDLYLRRHDRIDNWDLVDLGAPFVIGRYLFDRPRDELYELAKSKNIWERRTAIVATSYFIRQREFDDTYAIAELLIGDQEDLIHKAVGGWVREAGKHDRPRLLAWLDQHASQMPRTMLSYSIEHLDGDQKAHYRAL